MRALLGVPIILDGKTLGNLYLTNKQSAPEFSEHDQEIVEAFALYAASAIESASMYSRETELRRSAEQERARLEAILNSSPSAVVVVSADDGRIIVSNMETERILGQILAPGDDKASYETAVEYRKPDGSIYEINMLPLQRALNEGLVSQSVEVIFKFDDGREIPTMVNAAPVRDENGQITAAIAIFQDISAFKEAERIKAEFLSMISHDLRGPLATIKGLSSSLVMEQGPRDMETILDYIGSIDEEADRMNELVGNLLEMSRIEANAMPLDLELCHLADIIRDSKRHIERSRIGGYHKLVTDVPLELPEIEADYDQVGRVLTNLLSNAVKYSPSDSEIGIRSYLDIGGVNIITEIQDQGAGIPEDEIDKIFDKFYRVTTQRGRGRPGSGLGLAICKAIVEAHGGKLWVESKPNEGSTFRFSLPLSASE